MMRDHLDEAIDHVATHLVRVEDNEGLSTRILSSLPDRSPWSLHSWMPRLAITAVLAAAVSLAVLRMFDDRSTGVQTGVQTNVPTDVPTNVQANVPTNVQANVPTNVPASIQAHVLASARPNDRLNGHPNDRPNDRLNDHERSLEAIAAPAPLALAAVAPGDLPGQGALFVESLTIADLPLTADTISPR